MNKAITFLALVNIFILTTSVTYATEPNFQSVNFNFDKMHVESKVIQLKAAKQTVDAPYTVMPNQGNHFACIPGKSTNYGYRANNKVGWFYYLNPLTNDSVAVDFDFNLQFALDDSFKVICLLRPDTNGNFFYALEYKLEYPGGNTGNEWVNLASALGKSLHFVPNKDSVNKYGPIMYIAFRFDSNSIRNGIDGFGFGAAIDNISIDIYKDGNRVTYTDDFENEAEYSKEVPLYVGFAIDFWLDPGSSPDKWAWVRSYDYMPATSANPVNWFDLKRNF